MAVGVLGGGMVMMTRRRPNGALRRVERWSIGVLFAMIAFVLERVVMRSVKRRGTAGPEPTVITAKGPDAEV